MDNPHILIHWTDRAGYNRHKIALEIQDACNIRALARELVKIADKASDALSYPIEDDAAVILLVNKLESLVRSNERFAAAFEICCDNASGAVCCGTKV